MKITYATNLIERLKSEYSKIDDNILLHRVHVILAKCIKLCTTINGNQVEDSNCY